ncbi:hypothetical protein EVAR_82618_1 [Eumeta japonica]|uniref:Uncharacterized protein n=1 Tax=Eumeta variegata TaxID=151549 RepID=A0A4C1X4C6_EUMVA|nr:hypothetical protein EVAR_82618_1 [Eumeta japonica]
MIKILHKFETRNAHRRVPIIYGSYPCSEISLKIYHAATNSRLVRPDLLFGIENLISNLKGCRKGGAFCRRAFKVFTDLVLNCIDWRVSNIFTFVTNTSHSVDLCKLHYTKCAYNSKGSVRSQQDNNMKYIRCILHPNPARPWTRVGIKSRPFCAVPCSHPEHRQLIDERRTLEAAPAAGAGAKT